MSGTGGAPHAHGTTSPHRWPGRAGTEQPGPAARPRRGWWSSAPGAEAVAGAELLLGMTLWLIWPSMGDDYGLGADDWGPFAIGLLVLLVFVCVISVVVLPVLAFVHALVFTRPALHLARRTGNPAAAPSCLLAVSAACAVLPWVLGAPYAASLVWIAAGGVPPLVVAGRASRRGRRPWFVVGVTAAATALLLPVTVVGGLILVDRGVLTGYEPPRLEHAAYVGEWRGEDGGTVRLREGGRVEVEDLPVDHEDRTVTRCTATGTWKEWAGSSGHRGGVHLDVGGCAEWERDWEVTGTTEHPELFHLVGDPDVGRVQKLIRT
ncbi:hypothetical protein ACFTWH_16680 [Streptomyces sp. NPDC057011]|uniref:hypothetical protein n=1 Tax=unclassified Streptomyces TaxID=2593676 RepID=UPI003626D5B7